MSEEKRPESGAGRPVRPAGEAERQAAVDALCEAFAEDRLKVEEFERRVELAHRAESFDELRVLLADLPRPTPPVARSPAPEATAREGTRLAPRRPTPPDERVAEHSFSCGIMGGGSRRGRWQPARVNWALGCLGGFEMDFREARLPTGVTEVRVLAFLGGVEIIVPPDVIVDFGGAGIMGGFEHNAEVDVDPPPDAPVLRITGFAVLGGAEVSVRYPGETGRDARKRRKLARKERRRLGRGG